jgi:hypothetical protein
MSQSLAAHPAASSSNRAEGAVFVLLGLAVPFFLSALVMGALAFLPGRNGAPPAVAFSLGNPVTLGCAALLLTAVALSVAAVRQAKNLRPLRGAAAHG